MTVDNGHDNNINNPPTGTGGTGGGGQGLIAGDATTTPTNSRTTLAPKKSNVSVSPYDNFLDLSLKDMKYIWREMVKKDDDQEALDMTVTKSKAVVDFFQDKAITYRWRRLANIPTSGTGMVNGATALTPGGKDTYSVDLSDHKNLIDEYQHLTLEDVMAFASWFMGDINEPRTVRALNDMKMRFLDLEAAGNAGYVARFKQECRQVSCLIWHTIKNNFTSTSWKSLLVRKKEFSYECTETGQIEYEGFTLLWMIYNYVKPNVIVDINELQQKMEKITILSAGNDFLTLSTKLEELQQEINSEKGDEFLKDDKFLTELFRACEATTNELFATDVRQAKRNWMTGKVRDKATIIQDLSAIYRNMVADESWNKVSSADSKIIALTTQVRDLKKQIGQGGILKSPTNKAGKKDDGNGGGKKEDSKWRYTKVGETIKCPESGATLKWCPHHGTGAYMPSDHNHQEWVEKKKKRQQAFNEKRNAKRVKFSTGGGDSTSAVAKSSKDDKHPSKLQLNTAIRQSLVSHCSMTPSEADHIFNQAFDDAMASKE